MFKSFPEWLDPSSPDTIVLSIIKRFRLRKPPFKERINVEDWVPTYLNKEQKARFIFFTTSVDYGMKSPILYRGMLDLLQSVPDFLSYNYLTSISQAELALILKNYLHLRWPNNASRYFRANAYLLKEKYNNDILSIYSTKTGKEAVNRLKEFLGFGRKSTFLCFRASVNILGLDYLDINDLSMPIDRHKLKFTYLLGYISKQEFLNKEIKRVSDKWVKACKRVGISWLEFDRAFWIFSRWFNARAKLN